jgi:outer membrane protein assembly factor BamA
VLNDVAGQVRLSVVVSAQPVFGSVSNSAAGLIFSGSGGTASGNYYVLASTNVVLPVTNWVRLRTNVFDDAGNFVFTNAISPGVPQQFYRLQLP